jgi:hypothetical protein
MGPGVYKTQSKHTKPSHAIVLVRKAEGKQAHSFILNKSQGERGDGVPVSWLLFKYRCCKFANWPNSAGMGPGVYKTQSKHTKHSQNGTKGHKECKQMPSYGPQGRERGLEFREAGYFLNIVHSN